METIVYSFIALALMLVVVAAVYGGVTVHKAANGTASSGELAVGAVRVAGIIAAASLVAFATSYTATFLSQFG
ncbi:hypothetical protein G6024_15770 [Dietzia maris]|jgi:hypothetical protein|uniref:hypothetical protein n=1 Tax=unclassified Dietzia TaxID=2617939 RepID=UPI000BDF0D79|nr:MULTISPECIES: hypothetical protein [Dietzia]MBB0998522.1 hypothetical protein [Dietzia maris]MCY1656526.1 hypothetical protein [Dietzia sp. SL131]